MRTSFANIRKNWFPYLIIAPAFIWVYTFVFYLPSCQEVEDRTGIITDKWTKTKASFGGYTAYVFEINNNWTKEVTDLIYYNTEVGEYYNWTERGWEWKPFI